MAVRRSRAGNDILLGTIIRYVVWATIIGLIATPVLRLALIHFQVGAALMPNWATTPYSGGSWSRKTSREALDEARYEQMLRLSSFIGSPEMAAGAARSLHIVAVAFDAMKPRATGDATSPDASVYPDGYRRMTLDMTRADREAVLVIADQPIRWTIAGQKAGDWPRVAFEGVAALDIDTAEPRSIAALRIAPFGASKVMRVAEPGDERSDATRQFCRAAVNWSEFFALPDATVRFTMLVDPTHLAVGRTKVTSDGRIERAMNQRQVAALCDRYWRRP